VRIIVRIFSYIRPYWKYLILGYAAMVISIGMQLAIPRLVELVIDGGLVEESQRILTIGVLAIVGVGLTQGIFSYLRSYMFQFLAEREAYDVRNQLYGHMQYLPFSFFDRAHTGQLMSRGTEDINAVRRFMMFSLRMLVQTFGMIIVIGLILLWMNWQLAVLSLSETTSATTPDRRFKARSRSFASCRWRITCVDGSAQAMRSPGRKASWCVAAMTRPFQSINVRSASCRRIVPKNRFLRLTDGFEIAAGDSRASAPGAARSCGSMPLVRMKATRRAYM
jgi:ABC-type multidrug transport system fused ATPase/permease subunit